MSLFCLKIENIISCREWMKWQIELVCWMNVKFQIWCFIFFWVVGSSQKHSLDPLQNTGLLPQIIMQSLSHSCISIRSWVVLSIFNVKKKKYFKVKFSINWTKLFPTTYNVFEFEFCEDSSMSANVFDNNNVNTKNEKTIIVKKSTWSSIL